MGGRDGGGRMTGAGSRHVPSELHARHPVTSGGHSKSRPVTPKSSEQDQSDDAATAQRASRHHALALPRSKRAADLDLAPITAAVGSRRDTIKSSPPSHGGLPGIWRPPRCTAWRRARAGTDDPRGRQARTRSTPEGSKRTSAGAASGFGETSPSGSSSQRARLGERSSTIGGSRASAGSIQAHVVRRVLRANARRERPGLPRCANLPRT